MLAVLRIRNLAIIEESEIEFGPGLNAITGETGAGKSILLKAIDLITGARASSEVLRSGEERCEIEALFVLDADEAASLTAIHDQFAELVEGDELLIRRIIDRSGRSKIYVNGSLMTASLLQSLSAPLVDITGQHSQQTLLNTAQHRGLLDEFGVSQSLLDEVRERYEVFAKARRALEEFQTNSRERMMYFERLKGEYEELSEANLQADERSQLEAELSRLANVETLGQLVGESLALLSEGETNVEGLLRHIEAPLDRAAAIDPELAEARTLVDSAAVELREAQLLLEEYQSSLEAEPARLEQIRERIAELARLERKYGRDEAGLLAYVKELADEISELESSGWDEDKLAARLAEARRDLSAVEAKLTEKRSAAARKLSKKIEQELSHVNMKRARFKVELSPSASSAVGADSVAFTLAANPGEPFRPLHKVASGGELSRILLILKTVLSQRVSPGTQIFDEIDSGIGGAVAQIVGEKLKAVSQGSQVILITHAPQIAALADNHFYIEKATDRGRTRSTVTRLDSDQRVQQLAAMLAGKQVTTQFEASALELLQQSSAETSGGNSAQRRANA